MLVQEFSKKMRNRSIPPISKIPVVTLPFYPNVPQPPVVTLLFYPDRPQPQPVPKPSLH